ncbi:MAG: hypothetical protein AB7V43_14840 [Acidimicrobiia bacterium]
MKDGIAFPIFAERGQGVLAHPDVIGWSPSWRHAKSHSPLSVEEWETYLTHEKKVADWSLIALVIFLVLLVATVVFLATHGGGGGGGGGGAGGGAGGAGALAAFLRARRALRTLRDARLARTGPVTAAFARLWWSAGDGWGPEAMVTTASSKSPTPEDIIGHEPVVNMRVGVTVPDWSPCEIIGDLSNGGVAIIRCCGLELWPARPSMAVIPTKWKRLHARKK